MSTGIEDQTPEQARACAYLRLYCRIPGARWVELSDALHDAWERGESIEMHQADFEHAVLTGNQIATQLTASRQ